MMPSPCVCLDSQRRSCIVLNYGASTVELIAMNSELLQVRRIGIIEFMSDFNPTDYPVDRAAAHYLHAAKVITIAPDAQQKLQELSNGLKASDAPRVLQQQTNFIAFDGQPGSPVLGGPSIYPGNKEQDDMATKKPAAKAEKKATPKKPAAKAEKKAPSGRKPGAGALIKEMILAGKANDAILEKVRAQFPDSAANASTVSWYRSKLKKEGQLK